MSRRTTRKTWGKGTRRLASGLLLIHLFAVGIAPLSNPPPASRLARVTAGYVEPYLFGMFLNHGYRFFAPNPGPSHLVRYEVDLADGSQIEGRFPDRRQHWPRLLYHRHFMLSESLFNLQNEIRDIPADVPGPQRQRMEIENRRAEQMADALKRAIARQLLAAHNGTRVRLFMQQHEIPFPEDVAGGRPIDDPQLYAEVAVGQFVGEQQ